MALILESEHGLLLATMDLATLCGWKVFHTYDSRLADKRGNGFPDLVLAKPKRLLFVELKRETGKTTEEQDNWLATIETVSEIGVYLWRPSDWLQIERVLTRR